MEGLEIRVPERTRAQWQRRLGEMFAGLPPGYVEAVVHAHASYEGACEALMREAKHREDAKLARLCDRFPDASLTEIMEMLKWVHGSEDDAAELLQGKADEEQNRLNDSVEGLRFAFNMSSEDATAVLAQHKNDFAEAVVHQIEQSVGRDGEQSVYQPHDLDGRDLSHLLPDVAYLATMFPQEDWERLADKLLEHDNDVVATIDFFLSNDNGDDDQTGDIDDGPKAMGERESLLKALMPNTDWGERVDALDICKMDVEDAEHFIQCDHQLAVLVPERVRPLRFMVLERCDVDVEKARCVFEAEQKLAHKTRDFMDTDIASVEMRLGALFNHNQSVKKAYRFLAGVFGKLPGDSEPAAPRDDFTIPVHDAPFVPAQQTRKNKKNKKKNRKAKQALPVSENMRVGRGPGQQWGTNNNVVMGALEPSSLAQKSLPGQNGGSPHHGPEKPMLNHAISGNSHLAEWHHDNYKRLSHLSAVAFRQKKYAEAEKLRMMAQNSLAQCQLRRGKAGEIDLHGLYRAPAVKVVQEMLESVVPGGKLTIITGRGRHSPQNKPVLRPAILELLEYRPEFTCDTSNPGLLVVQRID